MTRTTSLRTAAGALLGDRREIGPLGTASRIAGGLIAIALPIALGGFGWWDAAAALVGLPLVATGAATLITAAYQRLAPEGLARGHAVCSGPACWLIAIVIGAAVGLDVLTPADGEVAFWVWLGASMLIAAARGYGGCEVLAVPNLITGRRDQVGCILYTPIDRAEARRKAREVGRPAMPNGDRAGAGTRFRPLRSASP
jgi:hypothetical protein